MSVLTTRIEAHPPQRRELVFALQRWAESVRTEDDATGCHLYEDLETPGIFALIAEWRAAESLAAHLRSEPFGVLQGALDVLAHAVRFEVLAAAESRWAPSEGRVGRGEAR